MSAKEYLESIQRDSEYLRQLKIRRNNLHIDYKGISAIDYSGDKVQSSPHNTLEEQAWKLLDRVQKIDEQIVTVSMRIDDSLKEIHDIDGGVYSQILFMVYVDGMKLNEIADKMKYDYHYICNLHGEALRKFSEHHNKS